MWIVGPTPRRARGSLIVSCPLLSTRTRGLIELRDARDAVRQPELRSQLVRCGRRNACEEAIHHQGAVCCWGGWVGGTTATTEC